MVTMQSDTFISMRAEIYRLLSLMYKEPGEDLSLFVHLLRESLKECDDENLLKVSAEMKGIFADGNQELTNYEIEYARLFVGPFKLLAPPYSSIYLEDKWEVMGRSTQTIESFYQRGGLCVQAMHSKPADHISIQFEFMYYLNFKLIETGDLEYLELQKEFLYRILSHWIPKFNAAIQEHAELAIYKLLGNLTERFIQLDYSSL
ncbi:molecular chaperone TorD family protein [Bacillus sp. ISL-41]|uniref:TorD/DmsD family molecular chaperone n=1 Tax=Bacillus sp. ISL-41 TaxID=2819127 RepID=UPI001BE671A9|nr:molecular chaperone TorD family protein [Bacillus sp. ISL-41]MBT2643459.1 molecular chaperone TorD family protein [Bacillus sp. ISL-41]